VSGSQIFKVRPIQNKDKAPLALIFQAAFSREPFLENWGRPQAEKRVAELLRDKAVLGWVVTVFGQPIGFSFLQLRQGSKEIYGQLLETAIHPYFQNQGVEKVLLGFVKQFQKQKKVRNVMTLVFQGAQEKIFKDTGWVKSKRTVVYVSR
jgi:ribosomal protein S18 acetylase RimI-like enzyme